MKKDYYSNSQEYINRWVLSYADFITMLLALFMVMYAMSQMNIKDVQGSVGKAFETPNHKKEAKVQPEQAENLKQQLHNIDKTIEKESIDFKNIEKIINSDSGLSKELTLKQETRGLIIRLNDAVLFDPGSDIIKSNARATLDKLAGILKGIKNPIRVEGHTDNTPINTSKFPSNWELSTARSINIVVYLMKNHKIDPKRLSAVGYGEYMPIISNNTENNRAINRRVDIVVLSSASEIFTPLAPELNKDKLEN